MDLDKTLDELMEKYGRNIEYNSSDDTFYEMLEGQKRVVRIETPTEKVREQILWANLFQSNATYEARLSPADRDLRKIIIDQVHNSVYQRLTDEGHMELRNGEYHPLQMGVCHIIWGSVKQILKDKYNIDWASPQDENPTTFFD